MSSVLLSFYVFWGIMSTYVIGSYYIYSKPNPRHPLHQLMMSKGCPITLRNAYIIWVPLKKTFSVSCNRRCAIAEKNPIGMAIANFAQPKLPAIPWNTVLRSHHGGHLENPSASDSWRSERRWMSGIWQAVGSPRYWYICTGGIDMVYMYDTFR